MDNPVEIFQTQEAIIRMQSRIIDKLFLQLSQYVTVEELDDCEIVKEINEVARLRS